MSSRYRKQWEKLLTPQRLNKPTPDPLSAERSPFLQDYDRIVFSSSFRRLAKKTQVHPLSRNDHVHNRLSHSLEVSCVGRSLGIKVGCKLHADKDLPHDYFPHDIGCIVQAACLAHDIGNPPFGHAGEAAIRDWFNDESNKSKYLKEGLTEPELADFCSFDGNAQGFRVINSVEMRRDNGGLCLTYPTIACMVKYPRTAYEARGQGSNKFNFYTTEKGIFDKVFSELGLKVESSYHRHPLSYLLEAADDFCYRIMDMEDANELNILSYPDIMDVVSPLGKLLNLDQNYLDSMDSDRLKIGYIRSRLINHLVNDAYAALSENYDDFVNGTLEGPLTNYCCESTKEYLQKSKDVFYNVIMKERVKTSLEIGSYSLDKRLLDVFIPAVYEFKNYPDTMTYRNTRALDIMGKNAPRRDDSLYVAYRRVIDFLAGMTDNYATFLSRQFSGTAGS